MPAVNPYLNFNGNTEEAFDFYKSVFGDEFPMVMKFKDVHLNIKCQKAKMKKSCTLLYQSDREVC